MNPATTDETERLPAASFAWLGNQEGDTRNQFVRFYRNINVSSEPVAAWLHLFADTRYKLMLNGRILLYGPARFYPTCPEYDTFDLRNHLAHGENEITVEVWSSGSSNFQSVLAPPTFWADGEVCFASGSRIPLATPGEWKGERVRSVENHSVPLSFALGPVEIRNLPEETGSSPSADLFPVRGPHAFPVPRSIPPLAERLRKPTRLRLLTPGTNGRETHLGCFRVFPETVKIFETPPASEALYFTVIETKAEQTLVCGVAWGDHFLNGEALVLRQNSECGNRHDATLHLRAGKNQLAGCFKVVGDFGGMIFGIPTSAELHFRPPQPDLDAEGFLVRLANPNEEARALAEQLSATSFSPNETWNFVPSDSTRLAPARLVAWERPTCASKDAEIEKKSSFTLDTGSEGVAILTLEFASEFFGHPRFQLDSPEFCTVDVSYDEFLRPDGRIDLFAANWLIHTTDRYQVSPGSHQIEGFHNRGGRFLQFNLRARPGTRVRLSEISVREMKTPTGNIGSFRCDNEFWNYLWETSLKTLEASLEDVWSDSPWREQGCYLGDSLVQFHAHTCLSNDLRLPVRILRLFAQSQKPDGQLCCVAPAAMRSALPDFTLIYVRFLRDYWAASGDIELVRELWPTLTAILNSPTWIRGDSGLIRTTGGRPFIDWSVEAEARQGFSSVLNALFFDALMCASEMAPLVQDSTPYCTRAEEIRIAMNVSLWDETLGRYRCTLLEDGTQVNGRALHGNTLALARGVADEEKSERLLPFLLSELEENAEKIIRHHRSQSTHPRTTSGQLEPYFLFYLFEALTQRGGAEAIFPIVRATWGKMREEGATTFWESIVQSFFRGGSLCHSWSVAPLICAVRTILGYTLPQPGAPHRVRIQPNPGPLLQAEGRVPHPLGAISIHWQFRPDGFHLHVSPPQGVEVICLPPQGIQANAFHLKTVAY